MNIPTRKNQGTEKARRFDRLFDQHASRVMGYLLQLTGSRAEAEDLTQETFLAAFEGQDRFEGRSQPLTWLLGIARRRLYDRTKRPKLRITPLDDTVAGDSDPADRLALAATLAAALDKLGEAEREVMLLTAVQGLTFTEAAKVLGEPVGTVKWRAHEATKQLRQILNAADERYEARYGTQNNGNQEDRTSGNITRFAPRPNR